MTRKAPGRAHRKGISLVEILRQFPDDATAEAGFVERRWPDGAACPYCGSLNVQTGAKHKTMPYRCREKVCAKRFSAKTGTVMEGSKLGFQTWMVATFLLSTNLKSVSGMKLHRDLRINQRSAWFLAHRLRVALAEKGGVFAGPQEFAARHNLRDQDTIDIMAAVSGGMDGKQLKDAELIADNGLANGARS